MGYLGASIVVILFSIGGLALCRGRDSKNVKTMGIKKKRKTRTDFICVNCRVHTVQFNNGKRWICSQCGTPQPIKMKGGKNGKNS